MSRSQLRFVDLFAGIGGFHLALHSDPHIDGRCVFASDIDPACQAVYRAAFQMEVFGDIQEITRQADAELDRLVPDHELLAAGFPCQPFSKSGAQRGIDEARGTLFYDICRVLEVKRPTYVLLENVMNLVGPRHRSTWEAIVALLRELGYAVSSSPTVLSPHRLPPGIGSPQIRDRVFIPGVYVGSDAAQLSASLPALVPRKPYVSWDPTRWRVEDLLEDDAKIPDRERYAIETDRAKTLDIWNELVQELGGLPGFPIWADVFAGRLEETPEHPEWKNGIIRKNAAFFTAHRPLIAEWLRRHDALGALAASFRKLEWQAGGGHPDIWSHAIQFRPSGIRIRPLTYLPALVAITQTSIIGPRRRRITPREAAQLQGFPHEFPFLDNPSVAYRQLGNAVSVGTARLVARSLLSVSRGISDEPIPLEWQTVLQIAEARLRASPSSGSSLVSSAQMNDSGFLA